MRHALYEIVLYLRTELADLKNSYPTTYPYPDVMLDNITYSLSDYSSDYIEVRNGGQQKRRYQTLDYTVFINMKHVNTDDMPFYEFEYLCKGVDDSMIALQGQFKNSFYYSSIINQTAVNVRRNTDYSYIAEMGYNIRVDIATLPDEEVELTT